MIKKRTVLLLPLTAIFFALSAHADVFLKDNTDILGKWKVYAEAGKLDGEQKKLIVEWDFKSDGTLETKSTDGGGRTKEMNITIKYSVVDGKIQKQEIPGRDKFESCKVVEKDGSAMTLKCKYLYYFLAKL
ncbi:conserved exported hypothetical protein [Crenothrix polyspora]|jgi:hypothetical protein|uniref:Lipocalin-like domain-containing protein n=1 Tax=Crenothrix polyspora TaxID=360316 RepID=A0A1R4HAL8_9GAMM|nr:hypothetical protein [Crenothrix polyspora]SJM93304.1 conserved exported hypothetical protein [Crenothrix polyspora]